MEISNHTITTFQANVTRKDHNLEMTNHTITKCRASSQNSCNKVRVVNETVYERKNKPFYKQI